MPANTTELSVLNFDLSDLSPSSKNPADEKLMQKIVDRLSEQYFPPFPTLGERGSNGLDALVNMIGGLESLSNQAQEAHSKDMGSKNSLD